MKVDEYFYGLFRTRSSTNGWLEFECPVCGKNKGAVHFDKGIVKCWRGCYHTKISYFLHYVMGIEWDVVLGIVGSETYTIKRERKAPVGLVRFPDGYRPLWEVPEMPELHKRARRYVQERGFDPDVLGNEGWGFCDTGAYFGRIIIPYYSKGILKYYTGRTFIGDELRYMNPSTESLQVGKAEYLFNEDALELPKVYLTEGAIDARSIGTNGIASGGWELSNTQLQKLFDATASICLVPDLGDAPDKESYLSKAVRLGERLLRAYVTVSITDYRALSHLGKDVNKIGWANIQPYETELNFNNLYGFYGT